jgi:alcohol dehydrogenase (cytochrome c)
MRGPPIVAWRSDSAASAVSGPDLLASDTSTDWLTATHGYSGQRFSSLKEITRANVGGLRRVCVYEIGRAPSMQSNPIVDRGTMYVTTAATTVAIDAATCRERWRYDRTPREYTQWSANRGVALTNGLVIRGMIDGVLLALDAGTGALRWERKVADVARGEVLTMPPLAVDSLILIGPAGSELAVSGWIAAFRARDGAEVWRFNTIADSTWEIDQGVLTGGGSVWTPMTYDPVSGTLYAATTNPAPDFVGDVRRGRNLYTNSVVALDVRTGALHWFNQLVPHDTHDWDVTQAGPVIGDAIAATGKDGILRLLDRATGTIRWQVPVSRQLNTHTQPTRAGTHVCPGLWGGVLWNGPAYSPLTDLLYVNAVDACGIYRLDEALVHQPPAAYVGGKFQVDTNRGGVLTAVDRVTGQVRWRYRARRGLLAAVTVTAGGVVFTGDIDGDLMAFDAASGELLLRAPIGPLGGGVVTYAVQGTQYVAAVTGRVSSQIPVNDGGPARVVVWSLSR